MINGNPGKYDKEISIRTSALVGALGAWLGPKWNVPVEVSAPAGMLAGWILDGLLFKFKEWWSK